MLYARMKEEIFLAIMREFINSIDSKKTDYEFMDSTNRKEEVDAFAEFINSEETVEEFIEKLHELLDNFQLEIERQNRDPFGSGN